MNQDRFEQKDLTQTISRCYTVPPAAMIGKTFRADRAGPYPTRKVNLRRCQCEFEGEHRS
jgi:hypothetical protein